MARTATGGFDMRRSVIAVVLAGVFSVQPASPQMLGGIATEWTQIMNNFELVAQYAKQVQMYTDMVKNSRTLGGLPWADVNRHIIQFHKRLAWARSIAATMANADRDFRRRFPGYKSRIPGIPGIPYQQQYEEWSSTALDTMAGILAAAQQDDREIGHEIDVTNDLRRRAAGTQGRLEALHAANALAAEVPGQIQKLRLLMIADMSSKAAFQGYQVQRDAAAE